MVLESFENRCFVKEVNIEELLSHNKDEYKGTRFYLVSTHLGACITFNQILMLLVNVPRRQTPEGVVNQMIPHRSKRD